jgi:predicted ATPase
MPTPPSSHGSPLYLKKVRLENVRCFEDLEFDLTTPDGGPRMWCMILGDNGVGKTSLLRSIAMGMCDEASAAGLLREIYGEWNRQVATSVDAPAEPKVSRIHLEFFPTEDASEISVTTTIKPNRLGYSSVKQAFKFGRAKEFPWDRIFACGYGAARRGFGTKDIDDYATLDAVYTLFNYDVPLQNPELVLRRVEKIKGEVAPLLEAFAEVLQLEGGDISLTDRGLSIKGAWGDFQAIRGLGDGFQATLAWLTDLIGWAIFYDSEAELTELAGIVLVDELEQHLHPRWQRSIVGLLQKHFPAVQFITTTHTPMCAIGTTDLATDQCELVVLRREGASVKALEDLDPPRGQGADRVLTSYLFGLSSTTSTDLSTEVARYYDLRNMVARSPAEETEQGDLERKLTAKLSGSETAFQTAVREEVAKALANRRDIKPDSKAIDFEILRQLQALAAP